MKKTAIILSLFMILALPFSLSAYSVTYQVKPGDIADGYIIQKIWLGEYATPLVSISGINYIGNVDLPLHAKTGTPDSFQTAIGMDHKKPFAVIRIPAFVTLSGTVAQVSSYTLHITEQHNTSRVGARYTDTGSSVLAAGKWYKIGITQTGFYKIDLALIKTMGIDPSVVNPANIRVFGNGARMLPENNSAARPADLTENAVLVNSGSDNTFTASDNAVFYAIGPVVWNKDSIDQRFTHEKSFYTDTAYYFITFDKGPGLHIAPQGTVTPGTLQTVTDFNYYDVHEQDLVNPAQLGKKWYDEEFGQVVGNTSETFTFHLGYAISSLYCDVAFAGTSDVGGNSVNVSLNSNLIGSYTMGASAGDQVMAYNNGGWTGACGSATANVQLNFVPLDGTGLGYLDYIEINGRRPLIMTSDQMSFRDWKSTGPGNTANYQLQGANGNTAVWDVTDPQAPVLMKGSLSGTTYSYTQDASILHEFAAMNSLNLYTPQYTGMVPNQNLHGAKQTDCIIVTNPLFLDQANQIAAYHEAHDHLRVIVATTTEVYNEFSSGGQDVSAIRDFARMFYKRAGTDTTQMPQCLLLFGGASYDYKNRLANNSNFVPVYESGESFNDLDAFSGDDFFGFLDDNDDINNYSRVNVLAIGVGRLPARTTSDADNLMNKIITYNSPATLGPWRISATIVADKGCNDPAGDHLDDAQAMARQVASSGNNLYNVAKVYVDAIPIISTPAGARAPNANAAIDNQVFKGTFLINYNGHGNPTVWSTERILTEDDYNSWNNPNMLPFMVTATCDFGQYDHPQFVSAAEQLVLRGSGGVIAVLTTTEAVYASYNHELNIQYLSAQFTRGANGSWSSFGKAYRTGKNATYLTSTDSEQLINFRKFSLLGDPALVPDFPQYNVVLDSVADNISGLHADTVKALGAYVLNGSVRDNSGNIITGFNGLASVSFYDKQRSITTISGCNEVFSVQDNLIYKGRVTVSSGLFKVSFITPKDINYFFGTGKVSTYAQNDVTDGAGTDTAITVGGFSDNPVISSAAPMVRPYINDSLFVNGGITGNKTSLYVALFDETGINVSGNNVGHDMTAVLDGNVANPYTLNDYYETAPNTYQRGYVTFPLAGLSDGHHSITVKAWDVNDNVGEGTVDFIVLDSSVVAIQSLMNYPNPFTHTTNFVFEHNHPEETLDVQIYIYNTSGALMKTINQSITPGDSRTNEITWNGTANNGSLLPAGVYVYRLNMTTEKGLRSGAYQKLVIIR